MRVLQAKKTHNGKSGRCLKRAFTGLFMFTSGLAILLNLIFNRLIEALGSDWRPVIQITVSSVLILWIFAGFWLFVYGLTSPCPTSLEY